MDWRAMSRSRSRISMDWRPLSRSRSRPPAQTQTQAFDQPNQYGWQDGRVAFPSYGSESDLAALQANLAAGDSQIQGRGSLMMSGIAQALRNENEHNLSTSLPSQLHMPTVYEGDVVAPDGHQPTHYDVPSDSSSRPVPLDHLTHSISAFSSPQFHPSSLPSLGLHGLSRATFSTTAPPENFSFPRHVRKTSFDHTVSRAGILPVLGRHQVNGRPLGPSDPSTLVRQSAVTAVMYANSRFPG